MTDLQALLWLLALAAAFYYWWLALGTKETALAATRRYCREVGVELLDDAIALRSFGIARDAACRLRVLRCYGFEFTSTGEERYRGRIVLLGGRVETIELAPHKFG